MRSSEAFFIHLTWQVKAYAPVPEQETTVLHGSTGEAQHNTGISRPVLVLVTEAATWRLIDLHLNFPGTFGLPLMQFPRKSLDGAAKKEEEESTERSLRLRSAVCGLWVQGS